MLITLVSCINNVRVIITNQGFLPIKKSIRNNKKITTLEDKTRHARLKEQTYLII